MPCSIARGVRREGRPVPPWGASARGQLGPHSSQRLWFLEAVISCGKIKMHKGDGFFTGQWWMSLTYVMNHGLWEQRTPQSCGTHGLWGPNPAPRLSSLSLTRRSLLPVPARRISPRCAFHPQRSSLLTCIFSLCFRPLSPSFLLLLFISRFCPFKHPQHASLSLSSPFLTVSQRVHPILLFTVSLPFPSLFFTIL